MSHRADGSTVGLPTMPPHGGEPPAHDLTKCESRSMNHMPRDDWTFLSNHGHVLVALARDPDARTRDVADSVGITERAVQHIVADLVEHSYVEKEKVGRRNRYRVIRSSHFRHDLESGVTLGDFVDLVIDNT